MTDIAALFARDPMKHTDEDISAIIAKMREARSSFNSAPKAAPKAKAPKAKIDLSSLDLGDL